jgi:hypothetical protein
MTTAHRDRSHHHHAHAHDPAARPPPEEASTDVQDDHEPRTDASAATLHAPPPRQQGETISGDDLIERCEELYPGRLAALGREGRVALLNEVFWQLCGREAGDDEDEEEEEEQEEDGEERAEVDMDSEGGSGYDDHNDDDEAEDYDVEEEDLDVGGDSDDAASPSVEEDADDAAVDDDDDDDDEGCASDEVPDNESEEVLEDMDRLQNHFPHFKGHYRLLKRIGEGESRGWSLSAS